MDVGGNILPKDEEKVDAPNAFFATVFNIPVVLWNREKLSWKRGTGSWVKLP